MKRSSFKKETSPLDVPMFSGSAYYIWRYEAVNFILTDATVNRFIEWNKDTFSPDEHLWATLQRYYPYVPGSYPPYEPYDRNELQTIVRIVKWAGLSKKVYPPCSGQIVRGICVYSVGDIPWLISQRHLFANKFNDKLDIYAVDCIDKWIRNATLQQRELYDNQGFL